MQPPQLVAHRGYPRHYPENTLAGIEAAIRAGARFVEVDVQLTRDGVPVLFHDASLRRVCGVDGAVHDFGLAELRGLRASEFGRFGYKFAREPIPRLAELAGLLERESGVTAFVEVKSESIGRFGVEPVLAALLADLAPVLRQCVPISYSLEALAAARARGVRPVGAVIDRWRDRRREALRALAPEYLFCDVAGLPRRGRLHHPGARLAVFEVGDARLAAALAARGVDLIETFAVGELLADLRWLTAAS